MFVHINQGSKFERLVSECLLTLNIKKNIVRKF